MAYGDQQKAVLTPKNRKERDEKIRMLYEEYIHLHSVMASWYDTRTPNPKLEPLFCAGMQGIELGFIILGEFISDVRGYVVKRPRVEMVAEDIQNQMELLAEICDGELEDDRDLYGTESGTSTLTQDFPFDGAPPTTDNQNVGKASQSPALDVVIEALKKTYPSITTFEKQSIKKVVRNITGTFVTCFSDWTVGVGVEEQLSTLRSIVGLKPLTVEFGRRYLDYTTLVKPTVMAETKKDYIHNEDFFFRSVHLGTECWAFIALRRLESAEEQIAKYNHWHNAAAHILSASHILHYLGNHVMMLTSMVLRDYLQLKVEIEGTSGEGSSAVKVLKPKIKTLYAPFMATLLRMKEGGDAEDAEVFSKRAEELSDEEEQEILMYLYQNPDKLPDLYAYAKALECIESGLLGGFYYKHFCLASNVIGSTAKGTMNKSVKALKIGYEKGIFQNLDVVRASLGDVIDAELSQFKGRIMLDIEDTWGDKMGGDKEEAKREMLERFDREGGFSPLAKKSSTGGCPFGFGSTTPSADSEKPSEESIDSSPLSTPGKSPSPSNSRAISPSPTAPCGHFDRVRRALYSDSNTPLEFTNACRELNGGALKTVAFLDHAWGKTPPQCLVKASKRQYALYDKGNTAWDVIFGDIIPEAIGHIRRVLSVREDSSVEFGHNSHELISRLISIKLEKVIKGSFNGASGGGIIGNLVGTMTGAASNGPTPMRILTTDTEFYSFTRQMNRLNEMNVGGKAVEVVVVPIEPLATFEERFLERAREGGGLERWDIIYVSQCVYSTQETIVQDLTGFNQSISALLKETDNEDCFFVIDGYHGFGAIPTDLSSFENAFYVSGMLKHVGSGANACFLVIPRSKVDSVRPLFTGWLADLSVLGAESTGLKMGSNVGWMEGFSLMGGTPSFAPCLIIFNEVMRAWQKNNINVKAVHAHVMALHRQFLDGLAELKEEMGSDDLGVWGAQCPLIPEPVRSHTLVFNTKDPSESKVVVEKMLRCADVEIDSRKTYVRIGFGFNHNCEDVAKLLSGCKDVLMELKVKV